MLRGSMLYRQQVARLVEALNDEHHRTEPAEIIRGLVDHTMLTPKEEDGTQTLIIELRGALAGILELATKAKRRGRRRASAEQIKVVAGAGFGLCALFIAPGLERLEHRM